MSLLQWTILVFVVASTQGEYRLEVTKEENETETTLAGDSLEVNVSSRFSLNCRVVDSESRLDKETFWNAKNYRLVGTSDNSTIIFGEFKRSQEGEYICYSPEFELVRVITLRVNGTGRGQGGRFKKKQAEVKEAVTGDDVRKDLSQEVSFVEDRKSEDVEEYASDVKRIKLYESKNRTNINYVYHHDGTTNIFRISLTASFGILTLIGAWKVFRCWKKGTLGPVVRQRPAENANFLSVPNNIPMQDMQVVSSK